jgi:hypothetical protein
MTYPKLPRMLMQKKEIESELRAQQALCRCGPIPKTAPELLQAERERARQGRIIADLAISRDIINAHLLKDCKKQAIKEAKQRHQDSGALGRLVSRGWRSVTITLQGGRRLTFWTLYYQVHQPSKRGRRRGTGKRRTGGSGCFPLLEHLGIMDRVTPATREHIARQVVLCSSYQEARENLDRTGLSLPLSTIVPVAISTGVMAITQREAEMVASRDGPLPTTPILTGLRVQVSLDGGRAKTRWIEKWSRKGKNGRRPFQLGWREPRVLTVSVLDEDGRMDRKVLPLYEVSLGAADEIFALLTGVLRRLGAHAAEAVVFVTDGADWIWLRLDALISAVKIPPERVTKILDFYHATEYIHGTLLLCKDLSASERAAEFSRLKGLLLKDACGIDTVITELLKRARGRRSKSVKEKVAYLVKHREHLKYLSYRNMKLPIGSGVVESTVRRVINLRFKSASMAWKVEHLEPLLYLRAILKAGHWERFLQARLRRQHWIGPDIFLPKPTSQLKKQAA